MRFAIAAASPRPRSDDRARVIERASDAIVCVADGAGGMAGSAQAAESFVDGVERAGMDVADPATWVELLAAIDRQIAAAGHGGETTGVALAIIAGRIVGASCGDSRAWLISAGATTDLTADQHRTPRLGTGRAEPVGFEADAVGTLVVATDGLFDHVAADEIARLVAGGGDAAALVELVRRRYRTLPDDVAVVIGFLDDLPRDRSGPS